MSVAVNVEMTRAVALTAIILIILVMTFIIGKKPKP